VGVCLSKTHVKYIRERQERVARVKTKVPFASNVLVTLCFLKGLIQPMDYYVILNHNPGKSPTPFFPKSASRSPTG
jgi:hypothetical protein